MLYIVFAQYRESYPDEYAPEAVAVISEFAHEENPDWIEEELKKAKANPDVVAAQIFEVDLGGRAAAEIRARLLEPAKMEGKIT